MDTDTNKSYGHQHAHETYEVVSAMGYSPIGGANKVGNWKFENGTTGPKMITMHISHDV